MPEWHSARKHPVGRCIKKCSMTVPSVKIDRLCLAFDWRMCCGCSIKKKRCCVCCRNPFLFQPYETTYWVRLSTIECHFIHNQLSQRFLHHHHLVLSQFRDLPRSSLTRPQRCAAGCYLRWDFTRRALLAILMVIDLAISVSQSLAADTTNIREELLSVFVVSIPVTYPLTFPSQILNCIILLVMEAIIAGILRKVKDSRYCCLRWMGSLILAATVVVCVVVLIVLFVQSEPARYVIALGIFLITTALETFIMDPLALFLIYEYLTWCGRTRTNRDSTPQSQTDLVEMDNKSKEGESSKHSSTAVSEEKKHDSAKPEKDDKHSSTKVKEDVWQQL